MKEMFDRELKNTNDENEITDLFDFMMINMLEPNKETGFTF